MKKCQLLELLFPTKCIFCHEIVSQPDGDACPECVRKLPVLHKSPRKIPFSCGCIALWRYDDMVRSSLLRFKFSRKRHYAAYYGQALAAKLQEENIPFDIITWVPVSTRRKFHRGYDQCALISKVLQHHLGIEAVKCLRKTRNNPPQSTVGGDAQRRANVLGVYRPIHMEYFKGKQILLIDDIITTGATISECAKELMMAGAKSVYCAAIAAPKNHK